MTQSSSEPRSSAGHHRPYEGQQHDEELPEIALQQGHHRPYEGQQRTAALTTKCGTCCHHRPYEGQQLEIR